MSRVVIFTSNNARLLKTSDVTPYVGMPNAVIDPDLSAVRSLSPHLWKLVEGRVLPLTALERVAREESLALNGADNSTASAPLSKPRRVSFRAIRDALFLAAGALIVELIHRF